ncbi:Xylose isomerase-like TIM barrel [Planctomycetes bacterium Pla163]|uniref:Xylose isomerase-like TIM barrel n=1 Tax=Rohdeia mirabilis TaxID=2528008 RepID=A0A518CY04_9BACT|nr:Xylose isomerase-like TIM barrel [Planctomycetes bacterium Pla163]
MTAPGIPNEFALSTACFGARLPNVQDQVFAAVGMGFRRIELGRSDAPPDMSGLEEARGETGIEVVGLVAGCRDVVAPDMVASQLGSLDEDRRKRAVNSLRRHARLALEYKCRRVIVRGSQVENAGLKQRARAFDTEVVEKGLTLDLCERLAPFVQEVQQEGQAQVQQLCRSLHEVMAAFPDIQFALEPGRGIDDLLGYDAMGWVLDDLSRQGLGYWHDVGRIHLRERHGLPSQADWLDAYGSRMTGVHLQDAADHEVGLPIGSGQVDFKQLVDAVPRRAERVVDVHHSHGRIEILTSVRNLLALGF